MIESPMFACRVALTAIGLTIATTVAAGPLYPDFNGDGKTDLHFYNTNTQTHTIWLMDGARVAQSMSYAPGVFWNLSNQFRDRNGDGKTDLLWIRQEMIWTGGVPTYRTVQCVVWWMDGIVFTYSDVPLGMSEIISLDFNGDGASDIVWSGSTGYAMSLMSGVSEIERKDPLFDDRFKRWTPWSYFHPGDRTDFNGDGKADLLWQRSPSDTALWLMDGTTGTHAKVLFPSTDPPWFARLTGDFNGDGKSDILWYSIDFGNSEYAIWLMDGTAQTAASVIFQSTDWVPWEAADFDGDGRDDLWWWNATTLELAIWLMDGMSVRSTAVYKPDGGPWYMTGTGDFNADGKADLLWQAADGRMAVWLMDGLSVLTSSYLPNRP